VKGGGERRGRKRRGVKRRDGREKGCVMAVWGMDSPVKECHRIKQKLLTTL